MFSFRALSLIVNKMAKIRQKSSSSTVFALSSGYGVCGVAVIRVSGPQAQKAITNLTSLKQLPEPRTAILRSIKHPVTNQIIDKGLILWFPGPRSFTGEDSCEFHVHGGSAIITSLLNALALLPNFKLAEPGEFSRRAFFNGKLDLTQVEGLADLLHAQTEAQRKQAYLQADGALSALYGKWGAALKSDVAKLEAQIDFEETETMESDLLDSVTRDVATLDATLQRHLSDGRRGELLRSGVKTVILGSPNVGKSSLLNLLCQRPASIVTPISGTTRDVISVTLNVNDYPLIVCDTAGLGTNTDDVIEREGTNRALDIYRAAHLILLVVDCQRWMASRSGDFAHFIGRYCAELGLSDLVDRERGDLATMFKKNCLIVLNKIDLFENESISVGGDVVRLSCRSEEGVEDLLKALTERLKILCGEPSEEHPSMTQSRHKNHIRKCSENLQRFLIEVRKPGSPDLVIMAEYLRIALRHIGKLTGTVTTEDILDVIFKEFCIGK